MKKYHIEQYPLEKIIYSNSYFSPLEQLENIEEELKGNYNKKLIFDLLLCNGNVSDRFISIHFNGSIFDTNKIKVIKPSYNMLNRSLKFYNENLRYVECSVLTKIQKFLIKKNRHLKKINY